MKMLSITFTFFVPAFENFHVHYKSYYAEVKFCVLYCRITFYLFLNVLASKRDNYK
jgi:hypothetical protein